MSFFQELKRRHVIRVGVMYVAAGWVLAEVAGFAADTFGAPDWVVQMFTILILLGFPLVLIGAWAFDITPHGLKRDTGPDEPTDTEKPAPVAAALVAAAPAQDSPSAQSIAVLPFVNMSDDASNEYFADGISEELLNLLAKIPKLQVTSRSSAFAFKGKDIDLPEVARKLNVAHILEGSVRKAGNQVRITAQLIAARTDTHLWSETWDRTLENIFAVQDEIAKAVVGQLKITLLGAVPTVKETDPQAYALYLQGRHLGRQGTTEGLKQSNALFEQALVIDPDYAAAWEGLAFNYVQQAGLGMRPMVEGFRLARETADKALALDPDYAFAHTTLGMIAAAHGNLPAAAKHYLHALTLEPANTEIIRRASSLAQSLGRTHTRIALTEYVVARDPLDHLPHASLGFAYLDAGRLDEAIASIRIALQLNPERICAHSRIGIALLLKGDLEAALAEAEKEPDEGFRLTVLAMIYHALGRQAESDAALAEVIEKHEEDSAYNIAYVLAYRNEADLAYEWLEKAVGYQDPGLSEIVCERLFANIHADPRWASFLERIGKSPEQLKAIEFDVKLPE